jgi:hypothetical protein
MVQTAPIRCTRLPHGDTTTIWAPYCACCSHIVPSASHLVPSVSHMVPHGSHKPSNSCTVQLAPIWPPYGAFGSHMVPSTSCMAHRASIRLPYGSGSSHTDHMAPIRSIQLADWLHNWHHFGSHMAQNGSHMAPIRLAHSSKMANKRLPYGPNMVHSALICYHLPTTWSEMAPVSHPPPIWCTRSPYGPQMVAPSTSHTACTASIWLPHGASGSCNCKCKWLPYDTIP